MDQQVEIKEEPVWCEGTTNTSLVPYWIEYIFALVEDVDLCLVIFVLMERIQAIASTTLECMTFVSCGPIQENLKLVSEMMPLKEGTKSEFTEPGPTQENTFEPSADIKGEILLEQHTVDQLVPCIKEENKVGKPPILGSSLCLICLNTFKSEKVLRRHSITHSANECFSCTICGRNFKRAIYLTQHSITHNSDKPFCCSVCGITFKRAGALKEHRNRHSDVRPYSCSHCPMSFKSKTDLHKHGITHTVNKLYCCTVCGMTFKRPNNLKTHSIKHTDIRPFSCAVCGTSFKTRNEIQRHCVIHSDSRPFACNICGESFKRKDTLLKYMGKHSDIRPH